MPDKVEILEENEIFRKFMFRLIEAKLRFERYNGELSDTITRINFERGDAVAVIMHNPADDTIVLIEQFRYPAYHKAGGWVIELPAGVVEAGESPDETMKREIEEETGYRAAVIHHLQTFFVSPGGTSERIFLYYGRINPQDKVGAGGGLEAENEDIKVMHPTIDEALQLMNDKKITDAKTLIGLQWLQLNRNHLPK
jgi:nudix-type nucleoside diphosphatase (YffH/AdpP family)